MVTDVRCDKTFVGDFDFAPRELPSGPPKRMFWYPSASRAGGRDGVLLGVKPSGADNVRRRCLLRDVAAYAVALSDRGSIAVVCGGTGYRVSAQNPSDWGEVSRDVVVYEPTVVLALGLVLFVGFTGITAWGPRGQAWDTGALVHDDLEVLNVAGHVLTVTGSSPPGTTLEFSVDLRTGTSQNAPLSR